MAVKQEVIINGYRHVLYNHDYYDIQDVSKKSQEFYNLMDKRRSVRDFSDKDVPKEVIEEIIKAASTAPSGAHKQPWTFCAVSNPELKSKIRMAAEKEEAETYERRMSDRWKKDLEPLGTDKYKKNLEVAPWLIIAFKRVFEYDKDGTKFNNYYVNESMGIACGMLITAIHQAGLVTLTHTPSPMSFLAKILERPDNERTSLLLPVGYPKNPAYVPDLTRKPLEDIAVFYE